MKFKELKNNVLFKITGDEAVYMKSVGVTSTNNAVKLVKDVNKELELYGIKQQGIHSELAYIDPEADVIKLKERKWGN